MIAVQRPRFSFTHSTGVDDHHDFQRVCMNKMIYIYKYQLYQLSAYLWGPTLCEARKTTPKKVKQITFRGTSQ